jgi:hypothetical protein
MMPFHHWKNLHYGSLFLEILELKIKNGIVVTQQTRWLMAIEAI